MHAHMKSGDSATFALCLDHHTYLPINAGWVSPGNQVEESRIPVKEIRGTDSSFENHRPVGQFGKMMNFFVHPVKTRTDQVFHRAYYGRL